tara:strand:- start:259 stop:636 length:378 start_codon:yes stop_codon:yes gene_type:complete
MVLAGDGQTVHLKGQVALDPEGSVVGAGDMAAQVRQVLTNIESALGAVGGKMSDIVSLTHCMTDIASFMACGEIRGAFFAPPYPVTTTVEVAALYHPDLLIEITATTEIPRNRFVAPVDAQDMHG